MLRHKSLYQIVLSSIILLFISNISIFAQEATLESFAQEETLEREKKKEIETEKKQTGTTSKIEDMLITAPREKRGITVTPSMTTIDVGAYEMPGIPQNVLDIMKDQVYIDFRGASDLVPENDSIYMRGFDNHRFTTASDGMTIDSGGFSHSQVVDYGTLSLGQIGSIEIIPGPHSALYGGKSIGGVINLKSKTPKRFTTTKPNAKVSTSYKSYNTQNHQIDIEGGVNSFYYGVAYQHYQTDGYLRNNEAEINNYYTKIGYVLPSDGHISLDFTYSDIYKEMVVKNIAGGLSYDGSYPETTTSSYQPWQNPVKDQKEYAYRLNYEQPHQYGRFTLGAYYRDQEWQNDYFLGENNQSRNLPEVPPDDKTPFSWVSTNKQAGGRIQDELQINNHTLTVGTDLTKMWRPDDLYGRELLQTAHDTADLYGYYLQDKWKILPRLTLTAGLRYEDVTYWRSNQDYEEGTLYITGEGDWIKRHRTQFVPKSLISYELDDLSNILRDTSVSVGISKIWNPMPFCYGCGGTIPSPVWVEPEHGVGYDFIFTRRLFWDIGLRTDFFFYKIKDYVVSNRGYEKFKPTPNNPVPAGLEYSDNFLNVEEMQVQGLEIGLSGHILPDLFFNISYMYMDLTNMGDEPAGKEAEDERAKHRVNVGLRYNLFKDTLLMLDYKFQDKQVQQVSEEVASDEYIWHTVNMDKYSVFDFALEQKIFQEYSGIKNLSAKLYINNLFDEEYTNSRGYPMTDRTFGCAVSFGF